ncbi:MAG TPA: glycosyltransferase [Pyrinomonadaceae bacterium]|jgi:glycosyltransferase involved in cell wall biosynthesis|nr:glycosyltransferase [Pyrinomonadaceae bacterium]
MAREISLDIVICTYNNAPMLARTLEAISRQKVSEGIGWRVLVVNNNCTDETPQVVEQFARAGRFDVRMVCEPEQGLTAARVCGVKNTRGEWVAFVDDDCLLAENWIEEAASFASGHPACGAFGGQIILQWEQSPPPYVLNFPYAYAGAYHGETAKRRQWLAGAGMVVRRAALASTGWIEKQFLSDRTGARLVSGGDVEIAMRVAARYEVWYNPACKIRHVIPPRRTSRAYLRRIVFGLGASRHNSSALAWRGSYPAWCAYAAACSVGFWAMGVRQLALEIAGQRAGVDPGVAFSPLLGWWSAMWSMMRMDATERRQLIGCAARRGD